MMGAGIFPNDILVVIAQLNRYQAKKIDLYMSPCWKQCNQTVDNKLNRHGCQQESHNSGSYINAGRT
jgi:hypothetical protein